VRQFKVSCTVTCSAYTVVEAETAFEAQQIAEQRDVFLSGFAEPTESFIVDEPDGEPQNIEVSDG
jgi:hypothetical protein